MSERDRQTSTRAPRRPMIALVAGLVLLLVYAASGLYTVGYNQEAVVLRFGRAETSHVQPGIHYHLPWPIESVERVNVSDIRRQGLGFDPEQQPTGEVDLYAEQFLTADRNIITVRLVVQYDVSDPVAFMYTSEDTEGLIKRCGEAAIAHHLANMLVDDVLTTHQVELALAVQVELLEQVDLFELGVRINAVQVKEIMHPQELSAAFNEVSSAREDRSRLINEAEGYANHIMPQARAQAGRLRSDGVAYKKKRIHRATGDAERFKLLAAEAQRDRENLQRRLYYETMDEVWPKMSKYLIGTDVAHITLFEDPVLAAPFDPNER